jgi:hypothetical protein
MIKRRIEDSLSFSINKNNKDELVIIVLNEAIIELLNQKGEIIKIGLNEDKEIEIRGVLEEELIQYTLPYQDNIEKLINRFSIKHILFGSVEKMQQNLLKEKINIIYEGLFKL